MQPALDGKKKKSEITKARLLAVGIRKFAEKGFAGATVDEIVEAARVNKRMVYHYFGSKEKLYQAALKEVYGRLANVEVNVFAEPHQLEETIQEIIHLYFKFLHENPDFVQLLLWENLNKGRGLEAADFELTKDPIVHHLDETIQNGITEGKIRPDTKVKHLLISLIGLCLVYFSNRYTLSKTLHLNLSSTAVLREGVDHAVKLVLHGIMVEN